MAERNTYLIAGGGISGIAAAELLYKAGERAILYDGNKALDVEGLRSRLQAAAGIVIVLGELPDSLLQKTKVCVVSPGIPASSPLLKKIREAGIPLWSEIELAYRYGKGRVAAITGTNGKTTTTALVGAILREHYRQVSVVGNIGIPYTEEAPKLTQDSVTAAEISSFQLETIDTFRPEVSAILNITPDHLDRHGTMAEYIRVKESITRNQSKEDWCVLNYEDPNLRTFGEEDCVPQTAWFSSRRVLTGGLYLENGAIISELDGERETVCYTDELNILGRHNYENVMAAVGICRKLGVPMDKIRHACTHFQAVEHRIEFVREVRGVAYYNDSKGTNPDAAIQAVKAMERPTILIGGGYDKGSSYDAWISSFDGNVKHLLLMGQTAEKIAAAARAQGFTGITFVKDMEAAVAEAAGLANEGEAVLLSPACASWGMFRNYEERGKIFKELVKRL